MSRTNSQLLIRSSAPTRVCDNGGWTDTWFAEYGSVFSIAITPRAEVEIEVSPRDRSRPAIQIAAENYGDVYTHELGGPWHKHPLIEATIDQIGVPEDLSIHIRLHSDAPPGASLGTSAAVTVALIGALDRLTPGRLTAPEIAKQAHRVETVQLGRECGIQDQLAAVHGGINLIEMGRYPNSTVTPIRPDKATWQELKERLLVVYMGSPHNSSEVHQQVIAGLADSGPENARLQSLRETADPARDALLAGDLVALGQTFIDNTEAQRSLHPALINPVSQQIIDLAQSHHVLGWKVNGAGGPGGSVALLIGDQDQKALKRDISGVPGCRILQSRLSQAGIEVRVQKS